MKHIINLELPILSFPPGPEVIVILRILRILPLSHLLYYRPLKSQVFNCYHSYCYIAKFADYVEAHKLTIKTLIYKVHDNYKSQHN